MYGMDRIHRILEHDTYKNALENINALEKDRVFCKHGLSHQMDVARIAYILYLEGKGENRRKEELLPAKEFLYAAALLHDIGKGLQYREGAAHDEAGAELAGGILKDCGFAKNEIVRLQEVIRGHGKAEGGILHEADRLSRNCFVCEARTDCYWSEERKNQSIHI